VEYDKKAIEFAKALNAGYSEEIDFLHKNIFRYKPNQKYDVIWSAGLFDYFNDEAFVRILKKILTWVHPEGKVVIDNFCLDNPSRAYMELIGEWYLEHRSKEKLIEFAIKAGSDRKKISVENEPEGINLFLHLTL